MAVADGVREERDLRGVEQQEKNVAVDYWADMMSVIRMATSKRMRLMIPLSVWTGISIAYYSGVLVCILTATMPDDQPNV